MLGNPQLMAAPKALFGEKVWVSCVCVTLFNLKVAVTVTVATTIRASTSLWGH